MTTSILLLLAFPLWAQFDSGISTSTLPKEDNSIKLKNLGLSIRELQSGRPTITGLSTFQGGLTSSGATTISGALTATSSVTIQSGGRDIILSTNTSTNSLRISGTNGAVSFAGTVSGLWQIFGSSSSSSNVGSLSVSGLSPATAYRLYVNVKKATAGDIGLRFNSDSGTVYKFAQNVVTEGSLSSNNGQINQTSIPLNWLSNDVADGDSLICQLVFETRAFGSNATVHVTGNCSETSTAAGFEQNRVGGYYSNTDLASVQVVALTGNLVGYMVVEVANR